MNIDFHIASRLRSFTSAVMCAAFLLSSTAFAERPDPANDESTHEADTVAVAPQPQAEGKPKMSRAVNIHCLRAFKKPTFLPQGDQDDLWERDFLTGWWGGVRSDLWDNGIEFVAAMIWETYNNVGGVNQGFFGGGDPKTGWAQFSILIASFDIQTGEAGLWHGGMIHLTTAMTNGESMAYEFAGNLNPNYYYDNSFADYFKVFEMFYEQKILEDKFAIRFGQIYPYVLIGACPTGCALMNGSFHYPTYIGSSLFRTSDGRAYGQGLGPAFIAAPLGLHLRYDPSRAWRAILQVNDGHVDPSGGRFLDNEHGLNPVIKDEEGYEIIGHLSHNTNTRPEDEGLPGTYTVGFQAHTGTFGHKFATESGEPVLVDGNHMFFAIGEQKIFEGQAKVKEISVFGKLMVAPGDINLVTSNTALGISAKGFLFGRSKDYLTVGYSRTEFGDAYVQAVASGGGRVVPEQVIEATYSAYFSPWLLLRPGIQWVMNPFGNDIGEDPFIIGMSTRISL
ncbi:MAG: hypothetical protein CL946_02035 [Ectothiorhodospiraceae bacterium]|nr:hypothetical protein [Ectothiorhodospiraceae bacterium]